MDIDTTIKTFQANCKGCGNTFEAQSCMGIVTLHCDSCIRSHEERIKSLSAPLRAAEAKSCVPEGYSGFDITKLPQETRSKAEGIVFLWQFGPVGIGLGGKSGRGKSFVIFELARRWQEHGKRIAVVKDQDIGRMVRENSPERDQLLARIQSADILVWDDFGLTKMTDAVEGTYNDILETIYSKSIPILGTANYGGEQLKRRWATQMGESTFLGDRGERMVGRFRKRCDLKIIET